MTAYYNGGDDDGVAAAAWAMSHHLDDAREEFVESGEPFGVDSVGPVVKALLGALANVEALPVPEAPAAAVEPSGGVREGVGWSARRGRRS